MKSVEVIEVVATTLMRRGAGVKDDPVRIITQYWSKGGRLLAEVDPMLDRDRYTDLNSGIDLIPED